MIDPNRDSTSVIADGNGIVFIDINLYLIAVSCESFIHRIVHDLIDKVVKSSRGGTADVHSRSLSYRFQPLQDLNLVRPIFSIKFCT